MELRCRRETLILMFIQRLFAARGSKEKIPAENCNKRRAGHAGNGLATFDFGCYLVPP
jgi:hypothetical protein